MCLRGIYGHNVNGTKRDGREHQETGRTHPEDDVRHLLRRHEFPQSLMGWQAFGRVDVKDDGPFERCPHYVVLSDPGHNDRRSGLVNEGYFGIGVKQGEQYRFSVWAKAPKGSASIRVQLIQENSMDERQEFAEQKVDVTSAEWKKYTVTLTATKTLKHAKLRIFLNSANKVCLEHVSLFPVNTYKNRENGMRAESEPLGTYL